MCDIFGPAMDGRFKTLFFRKCAQAAKKHGRFFASGSWAVDPRGGY
jgi:hypothetical protein